ncbi:MAG: BMP family ABC transporter substrate-binding protein [Chloroflexi bacterium]|nr:BMP family ABC transporter substrate-binding protein [Chloroflexota bacterium]
MKKNLFNLLASVVLLSLVLAACGGAATTAAPTEAPPTAVPQPTAEPAKPKVCEVTDTGGVDDKSFNQTAWEGAEAAAAAVGWEAAYLESQQQTDYEKNINEFIGSNCDLIVTVGFLLGDATSAAAKANSDQKFQILDFAYSDPHDNVWQQVYATDQGAFLAGYVAASFTKTGKVGTFGGINIPPVTDFMKGFEFGVNYYNSKHGANVQVLGWSTEKNDGLFTGNFDSLDDGKRMGETLMDEGADIILPVAGPVGLGTAAAVKERGDAYLIGVDSDWFVSAPEYQDIVLTSILKRLDLSVQAAVQAVAEGNFTGGLHVGNLRNGEIGIAPFHNMDSAVSPEVKAELEQVTQDIIDGKLSTNGQPINPFKVCEVTDTGGVDDKSFNQTAWAGAEAAAQALGGEAAYLESQQQTDYEKNINEFVGSDCDLIVTVGFLLGDATSAGAKANTGQMFQILDFAYADPHDNVWQQVYATEQGAFLAGYVAASFTKTGKVGTFGGINIPPVTDFMIGLQQGIEYYNAQKGANVELLGWSNEAKDGLFTGNFDSLDDGKRMGETLMDEGADIILPVAGPVGLGTAAAVKERGGAYLIGVDSDWFVSAPEYQDIVLTSILKRLDLSVQAASRAVATGSFAGGLHVGNLANGQIGIAPFHNFEAEVSPTLQAEVDEITQKIISGEITVLNASSLP